MRFVVTFFTALTAGIAVIAMPARPTWCSISPALASLMAQPIGKPLPPFDTPVKRDEVAAAAPSETTSGSSHAALQSALAKITEPFPFAGPVKRNEVDEMPMTIEAQAYQDRINEGWKIAREFVLRNSRNGPDFQEVVKEKSMRVMVLRWFEKAYGGSREEQLLDGYPAELDEAILDLLRHVRRFDGSEWPRLAAWDFDNYENHTLKFTIGVDEFWNRKEASEVKRHHHSRLNMLSMLEDHPALQNYSDDQILVLRNFLAQPALGFASRSFGYMCDLNDIFPKNCSNASLMAAAEQWASLYPHEARVEPRDDWLTLFEKFQWYTATQTDKTTVTKDMIETLPFREITEAWEKMFTPPPRPELECDPMDPFCEDVEFPEEHGWKPLPK